MNDIESYYEIIFKDNNKLELHYDNNIVVKGTYEVIGIYSVSSSIWTWGYAAYIEKDMTKLSQEIKVYHDRKMTEEEMFYVDNSSFFLSYQSLNSLFKFIKKVSNKKILIVSRIINRNIIEYLVVDNINQIKNTQKNIEKIE